MDKEGKEFTNGINKSDLAHDLLKLLNKDDILVSLDDYSFTIDHRQFNLMQSRLISWSDKKAYCCIITGSQNIR